MPASNLGRQAGRGPPKAESASKPRTTGAWPNSSIEPYICDGLFTSFSCQQSRLCDGASVTLLSSHQTCRRPSVEVWRKAACIATHFNTNKHQANVTEGRQAIQQTLEPPPAKTCTCAYQCCCSLGMVRPETCSCAYQCCCCFDSSKAKAATEATGLADAVDHHQCNKPVAIQTQTDPTLLAFQWVSCWLSRMP